MGSQNRCGNNWGNISLQRVLDGLRFSFIRDHYDDLLGPQDLPHRHRNRLLRNIGHFGEPAFVHLLLTTGSIEIDNKIRILNFKIGRRIVERQVSIFADPNKGEIYR